MYYSFFSRHRFYNIIFSRFKNDEQGILSSLKLWVCSGEPLPVSLAKQFLETFPGHTATLCNFYGSTEIMGDVSYFTIKSYKDLCFGDKIPIGKCNYYNERYEYQINMKLAPEIFNYLQKNTSWVIHKLQRRDFPCIFYRGFRIGKVFGRLTLVVSLCKLYTNSICFCKNPLGFRYEEIRDLTRILGKIPQQDSNSCTRQYTSGLDEICHC